jgi:hypothetical protein
VRITQSPSSAASIAICFSSPCNWKLTVSMASAIGRLCTCLASVYATKRWTLAQITSLFEQRFWVRLSQASMRRLLGALG